MSVFDDIGSVNRRRFVQGSGVGLAGLFVAGTAHQVTAQDEATPGSGELDHDTAHGEPNVETINTVLPEIQAPSNPDREGWHGLAFVGGGESNKLWVIDAKHHRLLTAVDAGGPYNERSDPERYPNLHDVHAMVFTKDFKEMFTVNSWEYPQSYAIKIDPTTLREVSRGPAGEGGHHSALSPDDKHLYVANQYGTTVSVLDRVSMEKVKDIEVGLGADYISPSMYWDGTAIDTPYLWVSVDKVPSVVAIDWRTNEVVKEIPCSGANHGVNITPDGREVWVAVPGGGETMIIDNTSLEVVANLKLIEGGGPIHIVFSPDSQFAYMTHLSSVGLVLIKLDVASRQMMWQVQGSGAHLGMSPDGKEVWTLNHTFDQGDRYPYTLGGQPLSAVRVFDAETGEWMFETVVERRPHEIQFVPYSAVMAPEQQQESSATGATPVPSDARVIRIVGKADLFLPGEIQVAQGERLRFEIVNEDTYNHIFGSGDPAVKMETIPVPASQTTYMDWTVDVGPGTYKLICGIHPGMQIVMVVS